MDDANRFRSHVDPAVYGIFRRIFRLAKNRRFPIAASGFTCSGHVYDEKLSAEQKKEYISMATGNLEKIHPGAYMYLLFRTREVMFEKSKLLHVRIRSINKSCENRFYNVVVESFNPSDSFPPREKDLKAFESGYEHILVRYELKFLKPHKQLTPGDAREAFRHFWQQFSDIIWSCEPWPWKLFRKRENIQPEWFSYRGLGDELLFE